MGYADGNADDDTAAGPNQIVVRYAVAGDANLDGQVNSADLLAVIQNFDTTGTDWAHGNFAYGGCTDSADLMLVIQNYNQTLPPPIASAVALGGADPASPTPDESSQSQAAAVGVPEPGALALAAIGAAGTLLRRKRARYRAVNAQPPATIARYPTLSR